MCVVWGRSRDRKVLRSLTGRSRDRQDRCKQWPSGGARGKEVSTENGGLGGANPQAAKGCRREGGGRGTERYSVHPPGGPRDRKALRSTPTTRRPPLKRVHFRGSAAEKNIRCRLRRAVSEANYPSHTSLGFSPARFPRCSRVSGKLFTGRTGAAN